MTRRVVITGMGALTSLGNNVKENWQNLLQSKSGISPIAHFDASRFGCQIASMSDVNLDDFLSARDQKQMDRFIALGMIAAQEAIGDSGWDPQTQEQKDRTGVIAGSGIGGLGSIEKHALMLDSSESGRISPYFLPSALINLLSGHISIKYGYQGPNSATCTACSTSAHAIGDAARAIKYGDADVMIAGGSEAPVTPLGVAGFSALRALCSSHNDAPHEASRPWDADRSGFVMGEGAGILVLEEYEHAKKRGAKIYAEILGYGMSGDAHHITAPSGKGAEKAMSRALQDAKISPMQVNYINAHGTSTPIGDETELRAVENIFQGNDLLKMSSTKSSIGHLLGATGGVELIYTALSLQDQVAPPTLNLHNPLETKIDLVPLKAKEHIIRYALSNSFGFGGTNASIVLGTIES